MNIASTKVKSVEFPTNANGLVTVLVRAELTPEFEKFECGGVGFGIATHLKNGKIPVVTGSDLVVTFDEKGEIKEYTVNTEDDSAGTDLPTHCVSCGSELSEVRNNNDIDGLLCTNMKSCIAQSTSPIFKLAQIAGGFKVNEENIKSFIYNFPETRLSYLSDLKFLITGDPNTEPRENAWSDKGGWVVEKEVWNYLKQTKMSCRDFWYIGFNLQADFQPREVLEAPLDPRFEAVSTNIDRVVQLVKFFDHWTSKDYVTKAY